MFQSKRRGPLRRIWRLFTGLLVSLLLGSVLLVAALRWLEPPWSAVMLARLASEGAPQRHTWVDLVDIAPNVALAVVAAEDQRFPDHWGFDTIEIVAAIERRLDGGRLRGASTISQQVARNLFLWQGRSFVRKGLEVWFTGLVELLWPKWRILEMYLNFAETGERLFGVGIAAQHYFAQPVSRLTRKQAATLAAVLPNPLIYRIDRPSAHVQQRRDWILGQMRNLGGPAYLAPVLAGATTY